MLSVHAALLFFRLLSCTYVDDVRDFDSFARSCGDSLTYRWYASLRHLLRAFKWESLMPACLADVAVPILKLCVLN